MWGYYILSVKILFETGQHIRVKNGKIISIKLWSMIIIRSCEYVLMDASKLRYHSSAVGICLTLLCLPLSVILCSVNLDVSSGRTVIYEL